MNHFLSDYHCETSIVQNGKYWNLNVWNLNYIFENVTICIFKAWSFRRNCLVFLVGSWINGTTQKANRLLQGSELILLMILHLTYFWYENIVKIYNFYSQNKKYSEVERVCVWTKNITVCKIISSQQSHNVIVFVFLLNVELKHWQIKLFWYFERIK